MQKVDDFQNKNQKVMKYIAIGALLGFAGSACFFNMEAPAAPVEEAEIDMSAVACSDSEGKCSERVVWTGTDIGGDWGNWRGPSEAGRYACGFAHSSPSYSWYEDDKGM